MGMRPQPSRPTKPRASARSTSARTASSPEPDCVTPIPQTNTARSAPARSSAYASIFRAGDARSGFHVGPVRTFQGRRQGLEAGGVGVDEGAVDATALDQRLERAAQERQVAAGRHLHEAVGDPGAEERALDVARHPVGVHPGSR